MYCTLLLKLKKDVNRVILKSVPSTAHHTKKIKFNNNHNNNNLVTQKHSRKSIRDTICAINTKDYYTTTIQYSSKCVDV